MKKGGGYVVAKPKKRARVRASTPKQITVAKNTVVKENNVLLTRPHGLLKQKRLASLLLSLRLELKRFKLTHQIML